jgi:xanthine dehydrogenase accessory factor
VSLLDRLAAVQERGGRAVLFTVVEGEDAGAKYLIEEGETGVEFAEQADEVIRGARNTLLEIGDRKVFGEVYMPPPRLFVYGAVDTAEALCRAAKNLGWTTIVADARRAFATLERFPSADELIVEWPEEVLAQVEPDASTAVVVLTHENRFDIPALIGALRSEAFYVGALGARRNQERRRERLLEEGLGEEEIDRIAGPTGLDIGAESPAETAVSILGEILAVRAGRDGGRLKASKGRIHVEVS